VTVQIPAADVRAACRAIALEVFSVQSDSALRAKVWENRYRLGAFCITAIGRGDRWKQKTRRPRSAGSSVGYSTTR